jgi:UDP-2,4-diacetamido-2,4,6-trideoxy-beta-L-altropyranose hydrolase
VAMRRLEARHGRRLTWSRHEADMAPNYSRCSVAVGSPGTATWERACIGLPSALIATASNQVPILEQLDQQGLCRYLGPAWEWHMPALTDQLRAFLQDSASLAAMRELGTSSVDGRGAERIVKRLLDPGARDA